MADYTDLRTDAEMMVAIDEILYGDHPQPFSIGDSILTLIRAIQHQAYEDGYLYGRLNILENASISNLANGGVPYIDIEMYASKLGSTRFISQAHYKNDLQHKYKERRLFLDEFLNDWEDSEGYF